jgi:hypothetical protein
MERSSDSMRTPGALVQGLLRFSEAALWIARMGSLARDGPLGRAQIAREY